MASCLLHLLSISEYFPFYCCFPVVYSGFCSLVLNNTPGSPGSFQLRIAASASPPPNCKAKTAPQSIRGKEVTVERCPNNHLKGPALSLLLSYPSSFSKAARGRHPMRYLLSRRQITGAPICPFDLQYAVARHAS